MSPDAAAWPAEVVRVAYTPRGLLLHFPVLRERHSARRLAWIGLALMLPALYAAFAYLPSREDDAAALLTLALTAVVVYPVILFGALFLLSALHAVTNSLTVAIDAASISCVRRALGIKHGERVLATAAVAALEQETRSAPRALGGEVSYRIAAVPAAGGERLVIAEGLPDEALCRALKSLIERYAQLAPTAR